MSPEEKEKLSKLESMFSQLMDEAVKHEGVIASNKSKEDLVKINIEGTTIISKIPKGFSVKKGDRVIIVNGVIVDILPEELISVEEEVNFTRVEWSEIGGMKSQIETIRKKVEYPITYADIYREFNMPSSKGILLYGPPGCGKTLVAKAIASHILKGTTRTNDLFTYVKGAELLSRYVGDTEQRIKAIFDNARKVYKNTGKQPVVFIDEAEAILPTRGSRRSSDVETTIVPTFLSEMDGFSKRNPFIILATNHPGVIDPAVQRPGRIDVKIHIDRPTMEDCVDIFQIHLSHTKLSENIEDLSKSAAKHLFTKDRLVSEVSGAMIANIVESSIERAIMRKIADRKITTGISSQDLIESINNL